MSRIELDQVRVGTPCPMQWEELEGDERKRFCGSCSLHVHNLSALPRTEAQALLDERAGGDGRLCITVLRRPDGSVVTADDPVATPEPAPIAPVRGGWLRTLSAAASLLFGLFPFLASCRPSDGTPVPIEQGTKDPDTGGPCIEMLGEVVAPEVEEAQPIVGRVAPPAPEAHEPSTREVGGLSAELGDVLVPEDDPPESPSHP